MNVYVVVRREADQEWPLAVYAKQGAAKRRAKELDAEALDEATGREHHVERVIFYG